MKKFLLSLLASGLAVLGEAQESDATSLLHFPKSDVREVLGFYQRLTNRPVLAAIDLQALVTVELSAPITREQAIELIRKTLLERYGIELRSSDRKETLATWSQDPKYPRRSDWAEANVHTETSRSPSRKIRIIPRANERE